MDPLPSGKTPFRTRISCHTGLRPSGPVLRQVYHGTYQVLAHNLRVTFANLSIFKRSAPVQAQVKWQQAVRRPVTVR